MSETNTISLRSLRRFPIVRRTLWERECEMSTFDAAEGDGVGIVNHRSDSYLMGRRETCLHGGYRATDSEDAHGSVCTPRIEEDRRRDSGGGGHWWWSLFPLPDALENPLRLYQTAIDHLLLRLGKMHLKLKTSSFRHSRVEASQERTRITSEGSG